jgi:hypothetical protein
MAGPVHLFSFAHYHSLFRPHLHPTLGVSLKDLSILWRQGHEALTRTIDIGSAMRCADAAGLALLAMWLSTGQSRSQDQNHERRD